MYAHLKSAGYGLASLLVVSAAFAQAPAPPNVVGGPAPRVEYVPPPPAGFDAATASQADLEKYHIPPAPNAATQPAAYKSWLKAVTGSAPTQTPTLTNTDISNGAVSLPKSESPRGVWNNTVTGTSNNWSGSATTGIANPNNIEAIEEEFVVPAAHQAFGACTGGWDYSSIWPGIDGYGSNDVLQGGVEVDAYCSGSTISSYYSAWVEWYPFNETRVSSPTVSPGDLIFVEVWNVSTTSGYVYFKNYSTNVVAEYHLTAPSGTTLAGNSVEWIVERPGINGGFATLTNYIDVTATRDLAWDYNASPATYYYAYSTPSVGTLHLLTMLDNSNNGISSATGFRYDTLWFLNFGSSCGLSNSAGNPC
jgi:hypothetical protein